MNKSKVCLMIGIMMAIVGVAFVIYALCNPQASFNIPVSVLYVFYLVYFVIMAVMFVLAARFRK